MGEVHHTIVEMPGFRVVGLAKVFRFGSTGPEATTGIPALWDAFIQRAWEIPGACQWFNHKARGMAHATPSDGTKASWDARHVAGDWPVSYGVCTIDAGMEKGTFTYLPALRVERGIGGAWPGVPTGMVAVDVPTMRYAKFVHRGPIHQISQTFEKIHGEWMPGAKLVHAGTPEFEVYDWRFSMEQPEKSEVEIFVPVG